MRETVSDARQAAFDILQRVATDGAYASNLVGGARYRTLLREDRQLLQELVLGVLRRQGWLDFLIVRYAGRAISKLDREVVTALRLGLYQLKVLTRIPPHAAINESVNLVKATRRRSAAPFVNAVLRAAQREAGLPDDALPSDRLERLSIVASTPGWLLKRWIERLGFEEAAALAMSGNQTPKSTFRYNEPRQSRAETDRWLAANGVKVRESRLVPGCAIVEEGSIPSNSEPVSDGWIYLQEESSQLVARLAVPIEPGDTPRRLWDVCAAPGGKSSLMAALLPPGSLQVASDLHWQRLQVMKGLFARQGLRRIELVQADLSQGSPFAGECFDQILVDAPCTGLGTLRKNPEIKWRVTQGKIREMAALQREILEAASAALRPGGLLTYSVCSTEPEEGEEVVASFRERHPEYRDMTRERLIELGIDPTPLISAGFGARTWPHHQETEGFFVALLWKRH